MICFHLLLHIILDLSYIAKWFSFAFCVVIKNVVSCNLHICICYEEKKKCCTHCMKSCKKKKYMEKKQDEIPPTLQHMYM